MDIIIKPKNINNLNKYINMGATAFIFGFKDLSVNATSLVNTKTIMYLKAKYKHIKIYISINKNIENKDLKKLKKTLLELSKIDIDGILFYDLAVVNIVKQYKLNLPLIWNQDFLVTNYETCNYYHKEGIVGAILSNEISIDEMLDIIKNTNLKVFVNVFGYQLITFSKRYLIRNYYKNYKKILTSKELYISDEANLDNKYQVLEEKDGTAIMSPYVLNLITQIEKLKHSNVDGIILNEKGIPHQQFLKIVLAFDNFINNKLTNDQVIKLIDDMIDTKEGFAHNKTIYKVKKNG